MRSRNILFLIIIIVVIIAGVILLMDRRNTNNTPSTPTPTPSTSTSNATSTPTSTQQTSAASVTIRDFAFGPASVTIKVGDTVTWTNQDSMQHDVKSDSGSTLNSGLLSKDQSFSFTFTEAGTYSYHCTPHPFMKGTVIVTN